MRIILRIIWAVLLTPLMGCLVGCTVTGGVVGPEGKFVQGVKLEVTADPDVKQAVFDYYDSMGTRYRFMGFCIENADAPECRELMQFIESFRDAPRVAKPESE